MNIKFLQAYNGDSILISFNDIDGIMRNVLIDGGMSSTYFDTTLNKYGALKEEIEVIRGKNQQIDLLILSHIDNDHIEGLLKWFSIDEKAHELIDKVWFNSGKIISKLFNEKENKDLNVSLVDKKNILTGVIEGLEFEKYLLKNKIWDKEIIQKGNKIEFFNVTINVLTPTELQLKKLVKEYKRKTGDTMFTGGKKTDWDQNIKEIIEEENKNDFSFDQDTSVKNGSSISILLTYNENNFLFLADSHPTQVSQALEELGFSKDNPVKVELMQIAHHGSKKNMNKKLLEMVETDNYVISTNSTSHHHPHKATLARIITVNPKAIIHFNYSYVRENVFKEKDFEDFPNIKTRLISEYSI
jgi:beta-lactamase superfamily II metal-dependent hydrolase|tara:strand:- start:12815 stop:13885 length:1071 start_codon:yes stop_codon:yes gene_type:complete